MSRSWFRLIPLLLLLSACSRPGPRRVILVTVDTLRADHLGCYGGSEETSPNLDRLARGAVLFEDATCQAPWTTASFASLMTGRFASESVDRKNRVASNLATLAELAQANGMSTAAVVANPRLARERGYARGFQRYRELFRPPPTQPGEPVRRRGPRKALAEDVTEAALAELDRMGEQEFLLWVLYLDPHHPYILHPDRYYRDDPPRFPEPGGAGGESEAAIPAGGRLGSPIWQQMTDRSEGRSFQPVGVTAKDRPMLTAMYNGEIRYVDEQVGRLLRELDRRGLGDDALLIVTSDHGESLFEHEDYFGHGSWPYDPAARVPLLIRWPGKGPGRVTEPVALVDLMPTILDHLGIPIPAGTRGSSLTPRGRREAAPILLETQGWRDRALREGPYKLVRWGKRRRRTPGLFHLGRDPGEGSDRAPEEPETADRLSSRLEELESTLIPVKDASQDGPELDPEIQEQIRALGYQN